MSRSRILFILPVLLVAVALALGWWWLRTYTRHGDLVRVPDLMGLSVDEAEAMLTKRRLASVVIDSVYVDGRPPGSVVDQDPDAGGEVKPDRKIYLILNAREPKMLDMPQLVDLSKRQALSVLEILGLKVKELQYKPDPCTDCVIDQVYKGRSIAPETHIRRGEAITLVLGSGEKGSRVPVPDLQGLTLDEVGLVLNMASLNMGIVVSCETCNTPADSAFARVHRQSPPFARNNLLSLGSMIDIWLTSDTLGLRPGEGWNDPQKYLPPNDTTDVEP